MSKSAADLRSQLSLPLIAAPMFLVSNPAMALAACKEGVVGSFPALNQRTSAGFEAWLETMNKGIKDFEAKNKGKKAAPYAVNLIANPQANPRLEDDLKLCVKHKVPIVITSLGIIPQLIKAVQSYGGLVLHDVTNVRHAKKAATEGVDGIIAVTAGAGGHGGTMNPAALVSEIRSFFDGILVLSGGMSHGKDIVAAEALGADFAYMGTRFINTAESSASPAYKEMVKRAAANDIVYTAAVSGVPANFLKESLEKANLASKKPQQSGKTSLKSLDDEAKAWKNIWSAGQGVGSINDIPTTKALITRLRNEYIDTHKSLYARFTSSALGKKTGNASDKPKNDSPSSQAPGTPRP